MASENGGGGLRIGHAVDATPSDVSGPEPHTRGGGVSSNGIRGRVLTGDPDHEELWDKAAIDVVVRTGRVRGEPRECAAEGGEGHLRSRPRFHARHPVATRCRCRSELISADVPVRVLGPRDAQDVLPNVNAVEAKERL